MFKSFYGAYQEMLIKFKDNALCLVSQISIKGYLETIALEPNNGLAKFTR